MKDSNTSVRPTRNRLLTAMGISVCSIALLLAALDLLVDFVANTSIPDIEQRERLTVHIKQDSREPISDFTTEIQAVRPLPQEEIYPAEFAEHQQEVASVDSPKSPTELQPVRDWHVTASEAAKASVDEYFKQDESRELMWRRSHSVMFQPAKEMLVEKMEPVISNIQFKRYSRVLGLGINIGSCFIGIPLAGVPVEKRQAAITVFVCGQNFG